MSDLAGFSRNMRARGAAVADRGPKLVRKVALAVDQVLVLGTPVDTGRARSNWQVQIGAAPTGTLPEPATPQAGVQRAFDNARAVIPLAGADGVELHITNNLDYIGRLNEGWSAQAPAGYVEAAVFAGVHAIVDAEPLAEIR